MTLYEIDQDATRRRIEAITTNGLRALTDLRQRSEDIDKAAAEMFERQERAKQELDEQVKAAAATEKADEGQEVDARPKPKRTLSLGGEEFHQNREAKQAEAAPTPAPPAPEPPAAEERPNRTFKLGARDEQGDTSKQDKPARKRPPRPDTDDDMSGRTWLR